MDKLINYEINNNAFDLGTEDEISPTIDCKYYNIDDFSATQFSPTRTFLFYTTT